jgi:hypothetical protein
MPRFILTSQDYRFGVTFRAKSRHTFLRKLQGGLYLAVAGYPWVDELPRPPAGVLESTSRCRRWDGIAALELWKATDPSAWVAAELILSVPNVWLHDSELLRERLEAAFGAGFKAAWR